MTSFLSISAGNIHVCYMDKMHLCFKWHEINLYGFLYNRTAYRKKRVTASNFGLVLKAVKRNSYPPSLFKTLLGQYNLKQGAHVSGGH